MFVINVIRIWFSSQCFITDMLKCLMFQVEEDMDQLMTKPTNGQSRNSAWITALSPELEGVLPSTKQIKNLPS